jgi:hypothetical protein
MLTLVRQLRPDIIAFSRRENVSPIEMAGLLRAIVLDLGMKLEAMAGIEEPDEAL